MFAISTPTAAIARYPNVDVIWGGQTQRQSFAGNADQLACRLRGAHASEWLVAPESNFQRRNQSAMMK